MNEELARIRKLRNEPLEMTHSPIKIYKADPQASKMEKIEAEEKMSEELSRVEFLEKIDDERLMEYIRELNNNMNVLIAKNNNQDYDEKTFVNQIIKSIYVILKAFNEMNIYPSFFVRKVFEMQNKYWERRMEKESQFPERTKIRKYHLNYEINSEYPQLMWKLKQEISEGYDLMLMGQDTYPKTSINDAFLEITGLYEKYNIQYKITTKDECKNVFDYFYNNYANLIEKLSMSETTHYDILYFSQLLYEYVSFLVVLGKNPKYNLDDYIEMQVPIDMQEELANENDKHYK